MENLSRDEVVVYNVDQIKRRSNFFEKSVGGRIVTVNIRPLGAPQSEGLVLPNYENLRINNGGLLNLSSRKYSPRDSRNRVEGSETIAGSTHGLKLQRRELREKLLQTLHVLARAEEFYVGLLPHVTSRRTPAMHRMLRGTAVHSGLAVNSKESMSVDELELRDDDVGLGSNLGVVPR